jgi:YHS domain-containing protein
MKSFMRIMLAVAVIAAVTVPALSQEEGKKLEKKGMDEMKEMKKAHIPEGYRAQATCPVMGNKIVDDSYVDYQGQRVYFCCAGCEAPFLKDPDKFFEQAAKDKVMFENVQTTCPMTGEPIEKNKEHFVYYKGRGIYFCSDESVKKFEAEPEKYLRKMREAEEKGHKEHKGHDHDH